MLITWKEKKMFLWENAPESNNSFLFMLFKKYGQQEWRVRR